MTKFKELLGRASWKFFHTMASADRQPPQNLRRNFYLFMHSLANIYPCEQCRLHLKKLIKEDEPKINSYRDMKMYFHKLHNKVNKYLGKPIYN